MPGADHQDVVIVGCGPVGATAALQLADAGLRVTVVEEHVHPYPYPRAVMADAYTIAILDKLLGSDFARLDLKRCPGAGYFLSHDLDKPFAWTDLDVGDQRTWFWQPQLETVLRDVMSRNPLIEIRTGTSARKLYTDQQTSHLTVEELATGQVTELQADFLLGCDGGNSFVRKQMGGSLKSLGTTVLFLIVDARVPESHVKGSPGCAYQVVDPERPTTFIPIGLKDHVRWEFRINPDDDILELQSPDKILSLLDPWADREHIELLRHTIYKFNSLIANQWRQRRVFVCGDAAHQTSPFLGQGLNMGIRNTRNLCLKIPLVANGVADDDLLDTYQGQCFEPTKGTIKESLRMGKALFNTTGAANGARSVVGNVRRGKPIDITKLINPTPQKLEIADDVPSEVRKVIPQLRVQLDDGEASFLTLLDPASSKVITKGAPDLSRLEGLADLSAAIEPRHYSVVEHFDDDSPANSLRIIDPRQASDFFSDDDYVVLAENSVLVGRYRRGDEQRLLSDYRAVFGLATN